MTPPSIDYTIDLVRMAHGAQVDKGGAPYWQHPVRVMGRLLARTPDISPDAILAALLHDVIEDTGLTTTTLFVRGYSQRTIDLVEGLTRNKDADLTYFQWIERIARSGDRELMLIKLADNEDNRDPDRLAKLSNSLRINFTSRYRMAARILEEGLSP